MPSNPVSLLRCPLCHAPLQADAAGAACGNRHRFDRAREGYLNLLPAQHKNSLHPGDDAAMVSARRDFLEGNHYAPLRNLLLELIAPLQPTLLLDCGCGEGWYTSALSKAAAATVALDISKDAVKRAAKRDRAITWLVASSVAMPLLDERADVMVAIFSPIDVAEAARVLRPDGSLFVVAPNAGHLWDLRAALYSDVRNHRPESWLTDVSPRFMLHHETNLQLPITLRNNDAVKSLLRMTPYSWRASRDRRTQVESLDTLSTQADFRIFQFRKRLED